MGKTKREHTGRSDLQTAAIKRRADAWALLSVGARHARGAAYLGGYAVECNLKAIAMETYGCWTLPELARRWRVDDRDIFAHGLEALMKRLPLYQRFKSGVAWYPFASQVNRWRVEWRYDPADWTTGEARKFLAAVDEVIAWLERNR